MSGAAWIVAFTAALVAGVAFAAAPPTPPRGGVRRAVPKQLVHRTVSALVAAIVVVVTSGWVVPGLVVGAGVFAVIARWQGRHRSTSEEIRRLDALASWIESVRDVLMAGEQPIGAITSSVAACPPVIRAQVRRLAVMLARQEPEVAFRAFADDLDDPLGDLVAAGLSIAVRRGARTTPVLTALAEQARHQVDRRRLIEAERAPARREVQALTLIMGALVLGLLLLGRSEYLAAYDQPSGQVFLAAALAGYAALLLRVQRLAEFPRPARFLSAVAR